MIINAIYRTYENIFIIGSLNIKLWHLPLLHTLGMCVYSNQQPADSLFK